MDISIALCLCPYRPMIFTGSLNPDTWADFKHQVTKWMMRLRNEWYLCFYRYLRSVLLSVKCYEEIGVFSNANARPFWRFFRNQIFCPVQDRLFSHSLIIRRRFHKMHETDCKRSQLSHKGLRKYWAWYLGLKCFSRHKPLRAQIRKLWSGTSIPILVCPWHSLLPKFLEHIPESFRWLGTRLGSRKQCSSWMGWRPRGFCSQTLEGSAATTWKIHSSSALLSQSGVTNPGWVPCWNISQNISPVFHKIVNSYLVQGQARGYGHNTQN